MYIGTLEAASNRADWTMQLQLIDSEDGDTIDLSGCDVVLEVKDECRSVLRAAVGDGVSFPQDDVLLWNFPADQMRALRSGNYNVGLTISAEGQTVQLIVGTLPVIDGIVS